VRYEIDTRAGVLRVEGDDGGQRSEQLWSPEGFRLLSDLWVAVGWDQKHPYTFTWLGRPVIQLPEDLVRLQEVVVGLRPDLIIETGVAHGGSAVFLAGLCRLLGRGRVVCVDVEIRPHNRAAIESHAMFDLITLIEGDSVSHDIVRAVRAEADGAETVLVLLDSNHSFDHVLAELEAYGPLVTPGSWIVATDGVMHMVTEAPRGEPAWATDNPSAAAHRFLETHPEFVLEPPQWQFNESPLSEPVTHWPDAWLRRRSDAR
jgi:cephalosporin hydroxylase